LVVDPIRLTTLVDRLNQYIADLKDFRESHSVERLEKSRASAALLERYLHRAIECSLDIATHVVVSNALGGANTRAGNFRKMAGGGLIGDDLADGLSRLGRYRNLIVHEYAELKPEDLAEHLQTAPELLGRFAEAAARLLDI